MRPDTDDSPRLLHTPALERVSRYAIVGLFLFAGVAVLSLAKEFLVPVLLAFFCPWCLRPSGVFLIDEAYRPRYRPSGS